MYLNFQDYYKVMNKFICLYFCFSLLNQDGLLLLQNERKEQYTIYLHLLLLLWQQFLNKCESRSHPAQYRIALNSIMLVNRWPIFYLQNWFSGLLNQKIRVLKRISVTRIELCMAEKWALAMFLGRNLAPLPHEFLRFSHQLLLSFNFKPCSSNKYFSFPTILNLYANN